MADLAAGLPSAHSLLWTTIVALRNLGDSGRVDEISEQAVRLVQLTEEQQQIQRPGADTRTEINYRLAWARTLGKNLDLLTNSARGVWALTDLGKRVDERQVEALKRRQQRPPSLSTSEDDPDSALEPGVAPPAPAHWKTDLLTVLKDMDADAFERLSMRLMREAGFDNVAVVGRTGDGGIDGSGVYKWQMLSFPVYFQCKRYAGSVAAKDVRDFRGATSGRGEKGIMITTGTFTAPAQAEATRDGATIVDLIDGERLVELLREFKLGVESTERIEYDVSIHRDFFRSI